VVAQFVAQKIAKKIFSQKLLTYITFKNSVKGVFLPALQVYLRCQVLFRMSFLTYLTKTFFSLIPFLEMIGKVDF
jgi:hypothetical protein